MIRRSVAIVCLTAFSVAGGWAEAQTTPKAVNPCAPGNPCAAKNPCAGGAAYVPSAAKMAKAKVISVKPDSLEVSTAAGPMTLGVDQRTQVRQGSERKKLTDLKAGENVTVSYVEKAGSRRAVYVYIAQAGGANPCAANPCAAKNPCGAKNPCAAKNPCGAKNPCAAKNPCGAKR